jgi:hypothetical protein
MRTGGPKYWVGVSPTRTTGRGITLRLDNPPHRSLQDTIKRQMRDLQAGDGGMEQRGRYSLPYLHSREPGAQDSVTAHPWGRQPDPYMDRQPPHFLYRRDWEDLPLERQQDRGGEREEHRADEPRDRGGHTRDRPREQPPILDETGRPSTTGRTAEPPGSRQKDTTDRTDAGTAPLGPLPPTGKTEPEREGKEHPLARQPPCGLREVTMREGTAVSSLDLIILARIHSTPVGAVIVGWHLYLPGSALRRMSGEPELKKARSMKKNGTHDGTFHCYDAPACFMLKQLPEYKDAEDWHTAAQVTVINQELWGRWRKQPVAQESVILKGAAVDSEMEARVVPGVRLQIGDQEHKWAPITDQCILGLDFLQRKGCVVNLQEDTVQIGKETIHGCARRDAGGEEFQVRHVAIQKRTTVPPHTEKSVRVRTTSGGTGDLVVQPETGHSGLLVPYSLVRGEGQATICMCTNTSRYITLKKGSPVGREAEGVLEAVRVAGQEDLEARTQQSGAKPQVRNVCHSGQTDKDDVLPRPAQAEGADTGPPGSQEPAGGPSPDPDARGQQWVPPHLEDLLARSKGQLGEDQTNQLSRLLRDFVDVFSKDDYDLGCFTTIKHRVDTAGAKPIRQRTRQTPLGFQEEEEAHLRKMLQSKVIRTRDAAVLDACDIVVDVGGVYDHEKCRYNHHQRPFEESMNSSNPEEKWLTKLSSAGPVYLHYGRRIVAQAPSTAEDGKVTEVIYNKVYEVKDRRRSRRVHQERLKICVDRGIPVWVSRAQHQLAEGEAVEGQEVEQEGQVTEDNAEAGLDKVHGLWQDVTPATGLQATPTATPARAKTDLIVLPQAQDHAENQVAEDPAENQVDQDPADFPSPWMTRCGRATRRPQHVQDYEG